MTEEEVEELSWQVARAYVDWVRAILKKDLRKDPDYMRNYFRLKDKLTVLVGESLGLENP